MTTWPPDPALPKDRLRALCRRRRRAALQRSGAALVAATEAALADLLPPTGRLGLYWAVGSEPDLRPLLTAGSAGPLADRLALPAVLPERGLVYLPWRAGEPLAHDACGIPAPHPPRQGTAPGGATGPLAAAEMALLLVPALAIDGRGLRLGSGGGWYDRLREDPAWRTVPALAVLPAACVVARLPDDPWDVLFDGWIDEGGWHAAGWMTDS
jgi:5-formyltetrahydrofolate cyclo-ligase